MLGRRLPVLICVSSWIGFRQPRLILIATVTGRAQFLVVIGLGGCVVVSRRVGNSRSDYPPLVSETRLRLCLPYALAIKTQCAELEWHSKSNTPDGCSVHPEFAHIDLRLLVSLAVPVKMDFFYNLPLQSPTFCEGRMSL
ncbi:hypothetical protein D3C78_1042870 [compost metagenome]